MVCSSLSAMKHETVVYSYVAFTLLRGGVLYLVPGCVVLSCTVNASLCHVVLRQTVGHVLQDQTENVTEPDP